MSVLDEEFAIILVVNNVHIEDADAQRFKFDHAFV